MSCENKATSSAFLSNHVKTANLCIIIDLALQAVEYIGFIKEGYKEKKYAWLGTSLAQALKICLKASTNKIT